ncbi:MAG: hypothetical protein HKN67_08775, partial [Saprospiraceae bacterium]|nr:hypothetical protein [Saprospiraceae bacterium]
MLTRCSGTKSQHIPSNCSFLDEINDTSRMICGYLEVPENHDKPDGKKITIAYVVFKSENTESSEFPLIQFTGGPGGQALRQPEYILEEPILKTRDIIRFDQRGIGKSSPLPDLTSKLYSLFPQDLTYEEEH